MYYIYKIENLINHKKYIGLTNNIKRRKNRHFSDLRRNVHDNHFLQKEFNKYGEENFSFEKIFEGDISEEKIGKLEYDYIKKFDSYLNGYNQNEGGHFGASNGGTKLTKNDLFNIASVLEFKKRPGRVLAEYFEITPTTISRIKKRVNHNLILQEYDNLPLEKRKNIYENFCKESNILEEIDFREKIRCGQQRKLNKNEVFKILANFEYRIIPINVYATLFCVTDRAFYSILNNESYKDWKQEYDKLTKEQKQQLVSLISDDKKKIHWIAGNP